MITIIPIEPISEAHGMLIVEAFSRLFIDRGGEQDGRGDGYGYSWSDGRGDGRGGGNGYGYGYGNGDCKCPEEWQAD